MKTILHNAKVYVEKGVYARAVEVEDGIITKVGTDDEILAGKAGAVDFIDCVGLTLFPCINDSHMHFTNM